MNHTLSGPDLGPADAPQSIIIVGGGAAANAAAEMLRREGYAGRSNMLGRRERFDP